jgi:hypothetical protein
MRLSSLVLPLMALAFPAASLAATPAADIMSKMETVMSSYEDQTIVFEIQNLKPGKKTPETMRFRTLVAGPKSFTEFLAPGDLKGTRVLATSPTQMWVYLPEYGRVRRVASHSLEQGFMGTTLTQQDMAPPAYGAMFDVTLSSEKPEDDTHFYLEFVAKDGIDVAYKKMHMVVDRSKHVPVKIQYFNDKNEVVRTETREDYTCDHGSASYCMFGVMKMTDHTRGDAWTELRPVSIEINTGLDESLFTPRYLQTGM